MENEYKKIPLGEALENITDEELQEFKFFIPEKHKIYKGRLEAADRTEVAQLTTVNASVASAVRETISLLKKTHRFPSKTS